MFDMNPDYYHIGIAHIDQQHDHLFELANQAYALLLDEKLSDKRQNIIHIMSELVAYARTHFSYEEAYMHEIGYAGREAHTAQHRQFEAKLAEVDFNVLEASTIDDQVDVLKDLLDFLGDWLINHIISEDMRFAES